ncbi:techylectin-5A-like [Diadema setosum]|uniref:techylectin-5A-like n=1 Tax=Diadema setosum TaxID=31175 RepID=UPI003B3BD53E
MGYPLGMENGLIEDAQLSVSSIRENNEEQYGPQLGRLNNFNGYGGWRGSQEKGDWFQVDIGTLRWVTGVQTQGRYKSWEAVKLMRVGLSSDGSVWEEVPEVGCFLSMGYPIGQRGDPIVTTLFTRLRRARFVKITVLETPVNWCLRIEILGFRDRDCSDIYQNGFETSGVYDVRALDSEQPIQVYCDMNTDGGGWMVLQRRSNDNTDFDLPWDVYAYGFGDLGGNHWLGLERVRRIFGNRTLQLRIDMEDDNGDTIYAKYSSFSIGTADDFYQLTVFGYSGDAGDGLSHSNGSPFSTAERVNDPNMDIPCDSCCPSGGWWYNGCGQSNLNGVYHGDTQDGQALLWNDIVITFVEMKVKPIE